MSLIKHIKRTHCKIIFSSNFLNFQIKNMIFDFYFQNLNLIFFQNFNFSKFRSFFSEKVKNITLVLKNSNIYNKGSIDV